MLILFRRWYYGRVLESVGKNLIIHAQATISYPQNTSLGDNVFIAVYSSLNGHGGLRIGNNVMIARNTNIWTSNHDFSRLDMPISDQGYVLKPVNIGDDVWIGSNVVILPGVTIGKGVVIGAGSVVTKNIPDFAIAAGNPAKVLKYRT